MRTLVIAVSARRRAALEKLLQSTTSIAVIGALPGVSGARGYLEHWQPDVVLIDVEAAIEPAELDLVLEQCARAEDTIGVILLVDDLEHTSIVRLLRSGAGAILRRSSSQEQIAAAVQGLSEELVVLSPEVLHEVLLEGDVATLDLEPLVEALTPRELEVLRMTASGLGNREIAERLGISEHTIKFHISSILGKLGAASRTEAVAQGIKRGLVLL